MLEDLESNFAEDIPKIIDANVRVLIYNGVKDLICNFIGAERWLAAMEWSGQVRCIWHILPNLAKSVGWADLNPDEIISIFINTTTSTYHACILDGF